MMMQISIIAMKSSRHQTLSRSKYLLKAVVNVLKIRSANKIVCLKRSYFPSLGQSSHTQQKFLPPKIRIGCVEFSLKNWTY